MKERYICVVECFHEGMHCKPYADARVKKYFITKDANFQAPLPPQNVYIFDEEQVKRLPAGMFEKVEEGTGKARPATPW